jgi:uncharacterized protein (DUF952 family)
MNHKDCGIVTAFRLDAMDTERQLKVMLIYKIFRAAEWRDFETNGATSGAPVDRQDGYIHFSTAEQLRETARKHFAEEDDLILAAIETRELVHLRWEPSRGGALFPHLYDPLDMRDVAWHRPLPLGPDGHVFPGDIE